MRDVMMLAECLSCSNRRRVTRQDTHHPGATTSAWCGCLGRMVPHTILGETWGIYTLMNVICDQCGHVFRTRTGPARLPDGAPPGIKLDVVHEHDCIVPFDRRTYTSLGADQASSIRRTYADAGKAHLVCQKCNGLVVVDRPVMSSFDGRELKTTPGHLVQDRDIPHKCHGEPGPYVVISEEAAGRG